MQFLYFDKERIESKSNIAFINGPFDEYSWVDLGGPNGSSLIFKLQNYSNQFKIAANLFSILLRKYVLRYPQEGSFSICEREKTTN
jgi:hypothetical protein